MNASISYHFNPECADDDGDTNDDDDEEEGDKEDEEEEKKNAVANKIKKSFKKNHAQFYANTYTTA